MRDTRRGLLRAGLAASGIAAGVGFAGCVGTFGDDERTPSEGSPGVDAVGLETVAEGFTSPVALADPPGDRRYVVDQTGTMEAIGSGDAFLDVTDRMVDAGGYDERGLLGVAFHPDYPDTPRVYVRYSAPPREGTPAGYSHTFVLSEFRVRSDGFGVEPGTERTLLEIPEPQANHNAGEITFGPDGYLYVAVGDGGGAGDRGPGHADDWHDGVEGGNGQDVTENLLGSILRIDVNDTGGEKPYGVPGDNPLVGRAGRDEHYAWGLRNPWGMTFSDGDLIVADVGQNAYEEINVVEKGGNYGWNVREGSGCFDADACPTADPDGNRLRDPVVEYPHSGSGVAGVAVVGGHVYDGDAVPALRDRYVFGDWQAEGSLFVADTREEGPWFASDVDATPASKLEQLIAIERGGEGDLYVLTSRRRELTGTTGAVHRIVQA
jgi:glucose/arabinose dehydrogenase